MKQRLLISNMCRDRPGRWRVASSQCRRTPPRPCQWSPESRRRRLADCARRLAFVVGISSAFRGIAGRRPPAGHGANASSGRARVIRRRPCHRRRRVRLAELMAALSLATDVGLGEPLRARAAVGPGGGRAGGARRAARGRGPGRLLPGAAEDRRLRGRRRFRRPRAGRGHGRVAGARSAARSHMELLGDVHAQRRQARRPCRVVRVLRALAHMPAIMHVVAGPLRGGPDAGPAAGPGTGGGARSGPGVRALGRHGEPTQLKGEALDRAVRVAQLATDAETGHRTFGPDEPWPCSAPERARLRSQAGRALRAATRTPCSRAGRCRRSARRVLAAEPGTPELLSGERLDGRHPRDGRVRRHQVALHARPLRRGGGAGGRRRPSGGAAGGRRAALVRAGTCTTWGAPGSSSASGTSRGR